MKLLSFVSIMVLISFVACGCSTPSRSTRTSADYQPTIPPSRPTYLPPVYQQDDTVLFDNVSYRINRVFWAKQLSGLAQKQQANASFLVLGLALTNKAKKPLDKVFNPIFKLEDSDDAEYESSRHVFILQGLENKMMLQPLNPNVTIQGLVLFDVPRFNSYKLRILCPFYAKEALHGTVELTGRYFYIQLSPTREVNTFEF